MYSSDSNTDDSDFSQTHENIPPKKDNESEEVEDDEEEGEGEEEKEEEEYDYEFTEEEQRSLCKAFIILDIDGDGVIEQPEIEKMLLSWGRMPQDDDLKEIMAYAKGKGCEGATGMSYENFQKYMKKELAGTTDENQLREAFQVFDSDPLTGKLNLTELRHFLKHKGMILNDDEIDFLFKEEDYWMLEEKNIFEYEHLINKIMDKPTCNSPFLNC